MLDTFDSLQEIAPGERLNVEEAASGLAESGEPLPISPRSEFGHVLPPLPRTSLSVMVVIDDNGYLMPLCTAGDLLRWCKAAWRAEPD